MSKPLSRPNFASVAAEWLRHDSGMDLQHQPVVEAHPRHLGQHLAAEGIRLVSRALAFQRLVEQRRCCRCTEVFGPRRGVAVVGRGAAEVLEIRPPPPMRLEIAVPGRRIDPGDGAQLLDIAGKPRRLGVDDRVGAIGRYHPPAPALVADHPVPFQVVECAIGGRDRLDPEALVQRPGPVLGPLQPLGDMVIGGVRGFGRQPAVPAEDLLERMLDPQPRRGRAEQVPVRREQPPDRAAVGLGRATIGARHAQPLQRDALRAEHPEHVVVGGDEQLRRIGEGGILGIPARIGMTMRRQDRQVPDAGIEIAGDRAGRRIDGEQPVVVKQCQPQPPPAPAPRKAFQFVVSVIC